jgi:hypothetical protein
MWFAEVRMVSRIQLSIAIAATALALGATDAAAQQTSVLGIPCVPEEGGVSFCQGSLATRVPTWDGVPLDVDVWVPPAEVKAPYPLIVALHGFGATKLGAWGNQRLAVDFARRGYLTMSYSARGQGASCGVPPARTPPACDRGWIHLADARYEGRDTQYLAGLLADAGLAKPKIGVTGTSYGGGQSLMLAALRNRTMLPDGRLVPWRSPQGVPMEIGAAAPKIGWSDLTYALVPTGRTLDYRSHNPYGQRIGIVKQSYLEGLFLLGEGGWYAPEGADPEADVTGWKAFISAGEPYDPATAAVIRRQFGRFRSAYYLLDGVAEDERIAPAPTVIWNAWTDDIMPASEPLRWANIVKSTFPEAEVGLVMGDGLAHPRGSLVAGAPLHDREREVLFDRHLMGKAEAEPLDGVITTTQACGGAATMGPFRTTSWAAQHPGVVTVRGAEPQAFTSAGGSVDNSARTDPFGSGDACRTVGAVRDPGAATYESAPAPAGGFTLIGSPTITARLRIEGDHPQITARVWDVAPDGQQTMVQHGTYRPERSGVQVFQIHPSGWHFAAGHVAKVELLGRDFPYTQPSKGTFSITAEDVSVELPVRERPDGASIGRYAPVALELSVVAAKRQRALAPKRLRLLVSCPFESCVVSASGTVKPRGGMRKRAVAAAERSLVAGQTATLKVRLPVELRRAVRTALALGSLPRASLLVTARDEAGNRVKRRATVRIVG